MNFKDPFDRLEELEVVTTGLCFALEEAASQIKQHSMLFEQMSAHLFELAQALNSQHRLIIDMGRHIKKLEENENNQ